MKLPKLAIKLLLRLHERADVTPYFNLPGYMLRSWVLGARCPKRNDHNPAWEAAGFVPPKSSTFYRWVCRRFAIRAHTTLRSDSDQHLHDHPCWSISIVLTGGYWEVCDPSIKASSSPLMYRGCLDSVSQGWLKPGMPRDEAVAAAYGIYWRGPGTVVFRKATDAHRLILPRRTITKSLFCVGKKSNKWGFYTEQGKVPAADYLQYQDQNNRELSS